MGSTSAVVETYAETEFVKGNEGMPRGFVDGSEVSKDDEEGL